MEPLRWNNTDPNLGARPQTSAFRGDKGLVVANQNRAPGGRRKVFLTCPYIDLRHPIRPGLSLASCQLIPTAITAGASRVASGLLCVHAVAITPAGSMELVRSSVSIVSGLPRVTVRSAPAITFSRPAQRSLALRPARSRSRQATLYTESSDSSVASAAASIATGWSEPVPGRELHPLESSAFHGALLRQLSG